ncbi:MAG: YebC/PmpR family DNA-binding transcriptional regulator [Oscillospiraceae bacterium]|nr:YebC/PmpR family DNA-binding transcriptional regulator [Oscillospiraceae bacterium]
MSGHSKWNNIKRKKEKTDAQKAKVFTKIGREISVAVREGGADPANNGKLRDLIAKAKASNVPNDNIDRIIKKAAGEGDKNTYMDMVYEGYGPCGVAVIVEALTDNKNRTAGDLRHYFDKCGGNLGQNGCVSYLFSEKGIIVIDNEDEKNSEDQLIEDCMEAGAEDFEINGEVVEVTASSDPAEFREVREALEAKGYSFVEADIQKVPSTFTKIDDVEMQEKMQKLLDMLDDNDDVQNVYHNWEAPEEE